MIQYWLVIGKSGVVRLSRWYLPLSEDAKTWVLLQLKQQLLLPHIETEAGPHCGGAAAAAVQENERSRVLTLPPCPLASGSRCSRVVYRTHGTLLFVAAIDEEELPLAAGELIDLWADLLRQLLGAPAGPLSEAHLAIHMDAALLLLDCMLQHGYLLCSDREVLLNRTKDLMKLD